MSTTDDFPTDGAADRATPRFRCPLRLKACALVIVVLAVSTIVLGTAAFYVARSILNQQINSRLSVIARDRQKLLLAYIQQQHERVALVASRTRFRQLADSFRKGELAAEDFLLQSQEILIDARNSTHGFHAIWLADPDGRVITATDETYLDRDYAENPDFLAGCDGPNLGQPFQRDGAWQAFATAPAISSEGTPLGVVMVSLDATPMVQFLTDYTSLGTTGEILVGSQQEDRVRYLLPPRHDETLMTQQIADVPVMSAAIHGESGFDDTTDYRQHDVLVAYVPVGYEDWGLIAKMDVVEAYRPVALLARLMIVTSLAVLLPGLLASYGLARLFTRRILILTDTATAVAAGDLDTRVSIHSHAQDEIDDLAQALEQMKDSLRRKRGELRQAVDEERTNRQALEELSDNLKRSLNTEKASRRHIEHLLDTIRDASLQLLASTSEILASMSQQTSHAQQQAAAVMQTSTSIAEIAQTAKLAAEHAQEVAGSAQRANEASQSGRDAVGGTIAAMQDVRLQVETTAERILSLAEQAVAVGEIISTVTDIAEQTNVLALNAAVEASRAGEHGKGFAVVASEVKSLANQSKAATAQVRQLLGEIQKATHATMLSTEQASTSVDRATGIADSTETTIVTLDQTIGAATRAAAQILASAKQQAIAMSEIHKSMENIRQTTDQSLAASRQTQDVANRLQALGDRLGDLIGASDLPDATTGG
jgi:methyl-accepting chemotaxis protein